MDKLPRWDWLEKAAYRRLLEELTKLDVRVNEEKTQRIDLREGGSFGFLGFEYRLARTRRGTMGLRFTPKMRARTALLRRLKDIFRQYVSQPVEAVIALVNPVLRGWVNYFRVGHSGRCFSFVRLWVEKKIRRHLMRARMRPRTSGVRSLVTAPSRASASSARRASSILTATPSPYRYGAVPRRGAWGFGAADRADR